MSMMIHIVVKTIMMHIYMCVQLYFNLKGSTVAVKFFSSNCIYADRGCTPNIISQIFWKLDCSSYLNFKGNENI